MPFIDSARATVAGLNQGTPLRVLLDYLLREGVGEQNAKPWPRIEAEFGVHNIQMSKEDFQQGLLADTRAGEIWVGSSHDGYFLIQTPPDAAAAREFIENRIRAQRTNLENLARLTNRQWPNQQA